MNTVIALLSLVAPFLIGLIAKYVWDGFEKLPLKLDALPSLLKPLAVTVVAYLVGLLGTVLQTTLPTDLHVWTQDTVTTLLSAFFAFLIHLIQKKQAAAAAAPAAAVAPAK